MELGMRRSLPPFAFFVAAAICFAFSPGLAAGQDTAPAAQTAASQGAIDQLTAPIALYPDRVLTNVLIASTYPIEVVSAGNWLDANRNLSGNALDSAAAQQNWDDSIKALLNAPAVLAMMSKNIEWTNKLGETFIAQQQDVIDSIQRLRRKAMDAGKLVTSDKQRVTVDGNYIYIEPVEEQVMYVPYYDPNEYYGDWAWADYPPYYWPAPPGYGFMRGFFTAAIIAGIWNGTINWPGHHVDININNRVEAWNRRGGGGQRWQHNAEHRRGMGYTRGDLQNRFDRSGVANRDGARRDAARDFRGFDQGRGEWSDHQRLDRSGYGDRRGGGLDGMGRGRDYRGYSDRGFSSRGMGGMRGGGFGGMRGGGGRRR
jgi:hypothetical protein